MGRPAPFVALLLLAGCNNPCQQLCHRMASFAEDCGYTIPDAELQACVDQEAEASKEDKATCREFGDLGTIDRTWDCAVAEDYWGVEGSGG